MAEVKQIGHWLRLRQETVHRRMKNPLFPQNKGLSYVITQSHSALIVQQFPRQALCVCETLRDRARRRIQ